MKRGKDVYDWFPLWSDKWIWGSTRHELTHEERAIWVDLLAVANKDDGYIRANDTTAYPPAQLAGMFTCSVELLESTISKCLKYQKIEDRGSGIFYICNWEEYALSKRRKQQIARNCETASQNDTSLYSILLSSLDLSSPNLSWVGISENDRRAWASAYPACDINRELLAMVEWIKANPAKGKKNNYRRFITNWLARSQEKGGGMKSVSPRDLEVKRERLVGSGPDRSDDERRRAADLKRRRDEVARRIHAKYDDLIDKAKGAELTRLRETANTELESELHAIEAGA